MTDQEAAPCSPRHKSSSVRPVPDFDQLLASASPQEQALEKVIRQVVGIQILPPELVQLDRRLRQHYSKIL